MAYVFIDPDGTQEKTLHVLIEASTGIEYAHQCAGLANETRSAEGFLIPLGGERAAEPLITWFWRTFKGNSYRPNATWTEERVSQLDQLVSDIPCWFTTNDGDEDQRLFLRLDETRLEECTEGWVPIVTAYGKGILIFPNCD